MNLNQELVPRQTLATMAEAWATSCGEVRQAFELLSAAQARLQATFEASYAFDFDVECRCKTYDKADALLNVVQRDVWACLIDRMQLRKVMSIADNAKLTRQLETGEGMPEITLPNLIAMLEGSIQRVPQMLEALVQEVYDWLRPRRATDYVTNQKNMWQLGRRAIKPCCVERGYGTHWKTCYHYQANLTGLDNVFHALDGKGLPRSHHGPLTDAISALPNTETQGETEYFRFKCYLNGNLHLEFKRPDLVDKLNAVAGGMRLGPAKAA